jgi:hypothetical protein
MLSNVIVFGVQDVIMLIMLISEETTPDVIDGHNRATYLRGRVCMRW